MRAALRSVVERLQRKYPDVPVRHIDHCNPAAQGDIFCNGNHFAAVNAALRSLHLEEVDWLPSAGWDQSRPQDEGAAERMGAFIAQTMELHKFYLERLQEVRDEGRDDLPPIVGVRDGPPRTFSQAVEPLLPLTPGLDGFVRQSSAFARQNAAKAGALSENEIAAFYLYTTGSSFYRNLNAALRHPDRTRVVPYFAYLRLFFSALSRLEGRRESLWRGVALDLRDQYPRGRTVTWWGVSSCTAKLSVAQAFLGSRGRRMLFEVVPLHAVGIRQFSAFRGEEEFVLPPGVRLKVTDVKSERGGLCTVKLEELPAPGSLREKSSGERRPRRRRPCPPGKASTHRRMGPRGLIRPIFPGAARLLLPCFEPCRRTNFPMRVTLLPSSAPPDRAPACPTPSRPV